MLAKTTSESRGCWTCSLQAPNGESPIVPGNSRCGASVVCSSGSGFRVSKFHQASSTWVLAGLPKLP